jgi:phage N-6-adenine-methyltransferase
MKQNLLMTGLTSKRQYWETPPEIFNPLNDEFNFTLDPCAEPETAKCKKYFTIHENGLYQDWSKDVVFCNPPYGKNVDKWIIKSILESRKGATVVMLLKADTSTKRFHDIIQPNAAEIRFLRGRVKFLINGKRQTNPTFASMVVIFKPTA